MRSLNTHSFIRGHFRHYLAWAALGFFPFVVTRPPSLIGIGIVALGAILRTWASGYLEKEGRLSIAGPFAYVRNPLYLGTLLIACGIAVSQESLIALIAVLSVGGTVLYQVVLAEERVLTRKFPLAYPIYSQEVPRFFPRLTRFRSYSRLEYVPEVRANRFSVNLFRRNRGHEAVAAALGLVTLVFLTHLILPSIF